MQIVILDGHTTNPGDLSWKLIEAYGECTVYDNTPAGAIVSRAKDAELLIVNKVRITAEIIAQLPELRCICLLATGYNNIDLEACSIRNIKVFNAVGYSTSSVTQQVFAGLLHIIHRIDEHTQSVRAKEWANQPFFSYQLTPLSELQGKTLGVFGFGQIGQSVGKLGHAFGMQVIAVHKHPERDQQDWVRFVDRDTLLGTSDVLTLHAPLNDQTQHFINEEALYKMKSSAILINTGRGGLIQEAELAKALKNNKIAAAYLDVLQQEPPPRNHPFYTLDNCFITPHLAWASKEARIRLIELVAENIRKYKEGNHDGNLAN